MFKLDFREKALKILSQIQRGYQLKINSALDDLKLGKFTALDIKKIGRDQIWPPPESGAVANFICFIFKGETN
ncbi:hypothetical protein KJ636_02525 [Patescibacteria group bacterium]|nr:hypothetical protein [Patescibacteria group bacterium]